MVSAKAAAESEPGPLPVPTTHKSSSTQTNPSDSGTSQHHHHHHHKSHSQHRITKPTGTIGSRRVFSKISTMEPPVQSFYGAEPIPLPTRFATIKRRLIQGREAAIEASWRRLLVALQAEIEHVHSRGTELVPTIDFCDMDDPAKVAPFGRDLKRYGVALVRGVVSQAQTETWIRQTREYLTRNRDHVRPTIPQDPTCFELFWTPAQCAIRAHPAVLRVQKWAMKSFWETKGSDADLSRIATRFPISYADRLRIHDVSIMGTTPPATTSTSTTTPPLSGNSAADSLSASAASTLIAQVDNGSLERWEPDGYGRGGAYEAIFRGDWESFDPWDPSGRINVTQDLYNGAGACSIFRMFQGILALTSGEPASIRVLPSPKLAVAYFLLRPFFSPKTRAPTTTPPSDDSPSSSSPETLAAWEAFLHPDNWALDDEQSTIIHGAVPGHAQRITELWHPHLRLRRSLVEIPTLQAGDYVLWHCDAAYSIMTSAATTSSSPPEEAAAASAPSMLMYTPACPLTQTNALFLARQRKAFLQGQPGPDFDAAGRSTAMGSEAPHEGRPGREDIAAVGGDAGLRAMGLAPWELTSDGCAVVTRVGTPAPGSSGEEEDGQEDRRKVVGSTEGEAEVVRLANIILFPDRYDFYIPTERAEAASAQRINGKAQAEQMAATRQLISRILS